VRAIERRGGSYRRLQDATLLQRGWGDCYGYVLVATGRAEIMVDGAMSVWDSAPLVPILREAGGRFTDWSGHESIHGPDGVGSNGLLHDQALALLRGASLP